LEIYARLRLNAEIEAPFVRVIGADGKQLGILATEDAVRLARADGLDLVEIAPSANPPVARIVKWRSSGEEGGEDATQTRIE
jgi:translation initiation factor IF-3